MISVLASCRKEDPLLPGRFLTDQIGQVDMVSENGVDYQKQLYFDMSSGMLKASHARDVWDLALGSNMKEPNVIVNPAMSMSVAATGSTDFQVVYNPADYQFRFERAAHYLTRGWIASDLAAGVTGQQVFLIDLARNFSNQKRGVRKIQITGIDASGYNLKVADLDNSNLMEVRVEANPDYNNVFVSLEKPDSVMLLEPVSSEWDLHFTKYMERLYDGSDTLDYSVTGCMINPLQTTAYYDTISSLDSTIGYSSLRLEDVDESQLTSRQDVIGHDWKYFDLDAGSYLVRTNRNFFIRDNAGVTYRMHFTGFYNNAGQKGAVSFEYLPL